MCFLACVFRAEAQVLIGAQNFDGRAPVSAYTTSNTAGSNGTVSGNTATGDRPQSVPLGSDGGTAFQVTNGRATLTSSANINGSIYSYLSMSLNLMAISFGNTSNGMETSDFVRVSISLDGGTTWQQQVEVRGTSNSNAWWQYSATGLAGISYHDGTRLATFFPRNSAQRVADGFSNIQIVNIPATAQFRWRVEMQNDNGNERWAIDNIRINGTANYDLTPASGDLIPLAFQSDAPDAVEFITGRRLNLVGLSVSDNPVRENGQIGTAEGTYTLPAGGGLADVPAGTVVRLTAETGTNDTDPSDGIIQFFGNGINIGSAGSFDFNTGGDQCIVFAGTSAAPRPIAGILGAGSDVWLTSGTPSNNTSYNTCSRTDLYMGDFDNGYYNATVGGDRWGIATSILNTANWARQNSTYSLATLFGDKAIGFNCSSSYVGGTFAGSGSTASSVTLNLAGAGFTAVDPGNTRFMVVAHAGAEPNLPANGFTPYAGVADAASNLSTDPAVKTSATTPTSGTDGTGRVLYLGYGLPTALVVNGLTSNTQYFFRVYALEGNGWSMRVGGNSYGFNFLFPRGLQGFIGGTEMVSGSLHQFGTQAPGATTDVDVELRNPGAVALSITSLAATGTGFSIISGGAATSIPAQGAITVRVRYSTTTPGLSFGTLDVVSDAANQSGTYTINLTGTTTPSATSDIIVPGTFTYPNNIAYHRFQAASIASSGQGVEVLQLRVRDGGTTADADNAATSLTGVTFTGVQGIGIIRNAALFNGTTLVSNSPVIDEGAQTIAFTGLSGANVTAPDNGTATLSLRVSFEAAVTDNQQLSFDLANTTVAAGAAATTSQFGTFSVASTTGTANRIAVVASKLGFTATPAGPVGLGNLFELGVRALDTLDNADVDLSTGTVTITKVSGPGTLGGTLTGTMASGVFASNNLTLNAPGTDYVLQAAYTPAFAGAGPSAIQTAAFEVGAVAYGSGAFRTRAGATNWGTAADWEVLQPNGFAWATATVAPDAPSAEVHVERSINVGAYTGSNAAWTANRVFVKGVSTTLTVGSGNGMQILGATGELRLYAGRLQLNGPLALRNTAGSTAVSTALLTVDSGATVAVNNNATNQSSIWQGVENFKSGSTLLIQNWNNTAGGDAYAIVDETPPVGGYTVSNNAAGYKFGRIVVNYPTAGWPMTLVANNPTVLLCQNNLEVQNMNGQGIALNYASAATITIGGNLVSSAEEVQIVSGFSSSGTVRLNLLGNLQLSGTARFNTNLDVFGNSNHTGILNLSGNVLVTGSARMYSGDNTGTVNLVGDRAHQITFATSSTSPNNNLTWAITSADTAHTAANWPVGSSASISVQTGGVLQLLNGAAIAEVGTATGTSFTLATGGTLWLSNNDGITTSGATGAVRTDTRSFNGGANYIYRSASALDQQAGNALPATLTGVLDVECADNSRGFILAQSLVINAPGKAILRRGGFAETVGGFTMSGTGGLDMLGGTYTFNAVSGNPTLPRLSGAYNITGGTIQLSGVTSGGNRQTLRGNRSYWNVLLNSSSSVSAPKTVDGDITVQNNLTINAGEVLQVNSSISGPGSLTMTGSARYVMNGPAGRVLPELTGAYTLGTGTSVELRGTSNTQQTTLRTHDGQGNQIAYSNVVASASAFNPNGNILVEGQANIATGQFLLQSPAVLGFTPAGALAGAGSFLMAAGSGLRFTAAEGINAAGSNGNIRVTGGRTFATQATYIAAGAEANATFGNGIPAGADTVIIARESGPISTAGGLKIGRKLRFASATMLNTGADTVTLDNGGVLVGEAPDRMVQGFLKVYRSAVSVGSETDFGNMGLKIQPMGASPGFTVVTRRTGAGAAQAGYRNYGSIARYYDIKAETNTGLNATITMQYYDNELGTVVEGLTEAFRSTDNGATWSRFNASARNTAGNFIMVRNVPGFSRWTIGSSAQPLPVEMKSFKGVVEGGAAQLTWVTAAEVNNAGFEVQRSRDGRSYDVIAFVEPKAAQGQGATYTYKDASFDSRAYYRLRQVDRDGQATLTQAVLLAKERGFGTPKLRPMPAAGTLTLTWPGSEMASIKVQLIGTDGKEVMRTTGNLEALSATLTEVFGRLPHGVYQLHLASDDGSQALLRVVR